MAVYAPPCREAAWILPLRAMHSEMAYLIGLQADAHRTPQVSGPKQTR